MDLSQFLTVGGGAVLIGVLVEVVKRGLALTPAQVDRWAPLLSISLGVVALPILAFVEGVTGTGLLLAAVTGAVAGAAACGLWDVGGGAVANLIPGRTA